MNQLVTDLYAPPDLAEAWESWDCSCGPAALAAILRRPAMEIRELFPEFQGRGFCNIRQMQAALFLANAKQRRTEPTKPHGHIWPRYGLAFIQISGPWEAPSVPVAAAYKHTHWIGVAERADWLWVYDINADRWLPFPEWKCRIMEEMIVPNVRRASGSWWTRYGIEVEPKTIPP